MLNCIGDKILALVIILALGYSCYAAYEFASAFIFL